MKQRVLFAITTVDAMDGDAPADEGPIAGIPRGGLLPPGGAFGGGAAYAGNFSFQ